MPLTFCGIKIYKQMIILIVLLFGYRSFINIWRNFKMSLPSNSRDLIKVDAKKSNLPIKFNPNEINQALQLVDKDLFLKNREDVKKYLPDILGRVLARIWIDKTFKEDFKSNPSNVLNENGVFLPDDMILEFQKPNSDRPKIIVYEKKPNSNFKIRVVQLQLVMLAGR